MSHMAVWLALNSPQHRAKPDAHSGLQLNLPWHGL